jgi:hypothetical protein
MPYLSRAQERLFNSPSRPDGITDAQVAEYNAASKDMALPEHVTRKPKKPRAPKALTGRAKPSIKLGKALTVKKARKISGRRISRQRGR